MSQPSSVSLGDTRCIDASAEMVWDMFTNILNYPTIFTDCLEMYPLSRNACDAKKRNSYNHGKVPRCKLACRNGDTHCENRIIVSNNATSSEDHDSSHLQPGRQYYSRKQLGTRIHSCIMTVTRLNQDDSRGLYEIGFATSMLASTITSSIIIERIHHDDEDGDNDDQCRVTSSFALIPNNWIGRLHLWACKDRFQRGAAASVAQTFANIAKEISRRNELAQRNDRTVPCDVINDGGVRCASIDMGDTIRNQQPVMIMSA